MLQESLRHRSERSQRVSDGPERARWDAIGYTERHGLWPTTISQDFMQGTKSQALKSLTAARSAQSWNEQNNDQNVSNCRLLDI
jgi:hypothetical protein